MASPRNAYPPSGFPISTKTSAYTATDRDYDMLCDATTASFTVTLPAAASNASKIYVIKKIDASVNTVTVDPNASETIDGSLTYVLSTQYKYVVIQCNGTAWYVIGNN